MMSKDLVDLWLRVFLLKRELADAAAGDEGSRPFHPPAGQFNLQSL